MKKFSIQKILALSFFLTSVSFNTIAEGVLGDWQTIDDKTNSPRSIVTLKLENDVLVGHIVKLFPNEGEDGDPVCIKCSGNLQNTKILGMQILDGMKLIDGEWKGGEILDPNNGEFYKCKIWIEDGVLMVRGYLGFFYRTQQWKRKLYKDAL